MHLREDRRHVQDLTFNARTQIGTRLNLEMACTQEMIDYTRAKPHSVCLVPENREEITTEGGLDIVGQKSRVAKLSPP